jgi:hypothetical protein
LPQAELRSTNHLSTLVVVVAALAFPSTAGAYLYWPNALGGSIGRANEDGTGVEENFISGLPLSPSGVAAASEEEDQEGQPRIDRRCRGSIGD